MSFCLNKIFFKKRNEFYLSHHRGANNPPYSLYALQLVLGSGQGYVMSAYFATPPPSKQCDNTSCRKLLTFLLYIAFGGFLFWQSNRRWFRGSNDFRLEQEQERIKNHAEGDAFLKWCFVAAGCLFLERIYLNALTCVPENAGLDL